MAFFGGVVRKGYSIEKLYEEMAFIAYYFHWTRSEIMNMEHKERAQWCKSISDINQKINGEDKKKNIFDV